MFMLMRGMLCASCCKLLEGHLSPCFAACRSDVLVDPVSRFRHHPFNIQIYLLPVRSKHGVLGECTGAKHNTSCPPPPISSTLIVHLCALLMLHEVLVYRVSQ